MSMPNEAPQPQSPPAAPPAPPYPQYGYADDSRRKSPLLAAVLSTIMPGLGQVYIGFYQRGFLHALVFAGLVGILSTGELEGLTPLFAILLGFFFLYNVVDGYRRAALYNQVLAGGGEIELPDDFKMPSLKGSIAGGITLAAFGALLLAHTRFDLSLDWIDEWWPAALIVFGLYLAFKAYRDQTAQKASESGDYE